MAPIQAVEQDKYRILQTESVGRYLVERYRTIAAEGLWWLEPMPDLTLGNLRKRILYSRRLSGIDGEGDPVWGASIIHMAEQASGTPFSISGPESSVRKVMDLMFSAPGGYREMIKQVCYNWVVSDIGAPVQVNWAAPKQIRPGVYRRPLPVSIDVFDPIRLRPIAPGNMAYPFAYRTDYHVPGRPAAWEKVLNTDEIPVSRQGIARIVNLPQADEELFGCGSSPTSFVIKEWQIAMGFLNLLLQDSTNTSAYTLLIGNGFNEDQLVEAMQNRQIRIRENQTHALASALMIFGNGDDITGDNGPKIGQVPLRRYADGWDWRMWMEERIQIYATILGISPMSIIMSIYARANQAGAQYAADEAGVRRTSLMVGLSDIFATLSDLLGGSFQYRSHRLADRDREFAVFKTAVESWTKLYESENNGIPLLADTPEEAAKRARRMMAEQRLIHPDYAEGEEAVTWDAAMDGSLQGSSAGKMLAYLGAAKRGERWIETNVDPGVDTTKVTTTVIGRCVIRETGQPTQWRGKSMLPAMRRSKALRAALKARQGAMIALYPSETDAFDLAIEGGEAPSDLHLTLAYIEDRKSLSLGVARDITRVLASKTPIQLAKISGYGRLVRSHKEGMQVIYASVDSPDLDDIHEHAVEALRSVGGQVPADRGFLAHITLAYINEEDESPIRSLPEKPIVFDRMVLAWGNRMFTYPLSAMQMKESSRVAAGAPRGQRALQQGWENDLEAALKSLRSAESSSKTTISDGDLAKLQQLLDKWENGIDAIETSNPDANVAVKIGRARELIDEIQREIDSKDDQHKLLVLLAIFLFADDIQRRGTQHVVDGMGLAGVLPGNLLLQRELERLGMYVQGSLTTDMVSEYLAAGRISSRLERRMMVFYGGALWVAMQLAVMKSAEAGTVMMVDGPQDANNCMESDPGPGVACETIVGKTYIVGQDSMPVLGRDTKCGQACRHWWTVVQ